MGYFMSKLIQVFDGFSASNPARIVMLGLDAAGKTTILYKMKLNEIVTTIPTIGFNVETVQPRKGISFTVWDVGGQDKIRPLWKHYFQNTDGLIYVVDCNDKERLGESREELHNLLESEDMRSVPVVVIANKQDIPGSCSPHEVISALQLSQLKGRKWHVQGACATNGDGLYEAMDELAPMVKEFKKQRGR